MENETEGISPENSARIKYEERQMRILSWITKNSNPKFLVLPKFVRKRTRFQKRGPMSNADWLRWKKWVKKFGAPKGKYPPIFSEFQKKRHLRDTKKIKENVGDFVKKFDKNRMSLLAKPKLIRIQKKYKTPPQEVLTFIPKINSPDLKKSKPRKPKVRIGVKRGALKYKLTNYTRKLAKPKQQQQFDSQLNQTQNTKFSPAQWIQYKSYLNILSFPKIQLPPENFAANQFKNGFINCTCEFETTTWN